MSGATLLVSRFTHLFPFYKSCFEAWGFSDVYTTGKEKDGLNMLINEINPRYVFIDSCFYSFATPCMMGQLLRSFPQLNITAVTLHSFPDNLAMWFVFHGVRNYIKMADGMAEFQQGMRCILDGKKYVAPSVLAIIEALPEWLEVKDKADRRQIEVLLMLCNGNSPDDIAGCLHVTRKTVDWHIDQLKKVFHVQTREQLIIMAFYLDVVTKDDMCFFSRNKKMVKLPEWAECKIGKKNEIKKSFNDTNIS